MTLSRVGPAAVLVLAVVALLGPSLVTSAAPVLGVITPHGHEGHDHLHLPWTLPDADAEGSDRSTGEFPEQSSPFPVGVIPAVAMVALVLCMFEGLRSDVGQVCRRTIRPPRPPPKLALQ